MYKTNVDQDFAMSKLEFEQKISKKLMKKLEKVSKF